MSLPGDKLISQNDRIERVRSTQARNRTLIAGAIVGVIALFMVILTWVAVLHSTKSTPASRVVQAPATETPPKLHANPAAANQIQSQNQQQLNAATATGRSYIPRPVIACCTATTVGRSSAALVAGDMAPQPPLKMPPMPAAYVDNTPTPPAPHFGSSRDAPTLDAQAEQNLSKEIATVISSQTPDPPAQVELLPTRSAPTTSAMADQHAAAQLASATATEALIPIKVGNLFYATMDTRVNSDVPGPVMATIDEGPAKNARVIGSFIREHAVLNLKFTTLVMSNGTHYTITAYAVDPNTSETAVASAADHHYFSRWAGLIAASFIQGYGQAIAQSGATVTSSVGPNGVTTTTQNGHYGANEAAQIAGGVAAGQMVSAAQQNFNRATTVTLAEGSGIGVLVTSVSGGPS